MKVAGIVVEYNPLHFGHVHHINETKQLSGADVLVAVMSGHVVQRGNFSIADKFTKTKWALEAGIDLVIELPSVFALQSADLFAETSVHLLKFMGVTDLYFGSETGKIEPLIEAAKLMREDHFQDSLKLYIQQGYSYPTSADMAIQALTTNKAVHHLPNNILGIQYIQAIHKLNANIIPHTIQRIDTNYYDGVKKDTVIQSATAIRECIATSKDYQPFVPDYVYQDLRNHTYIDIERFTPYFDYLFNVHRPSTMKEFFSFEEGFENRLLKIEPVESINQIIKEASTARYTQAKVRRSLMHLLLNVRKDFIDTFTPPYIRVLGMNKNGQAHLNRIKKDLEDANIPLITKIKKDRHLYLDIELNVTRLYDMVVKRDLLKHEFKPVIIK